MFLQTPEAKRRAAGLTAIAGTLDLAVTAGTELPTWSDEDPTAIVVTEDQKTILASSTSPTELQQVLVSPGGGEYPGLHDVSLRPNEYLRKTTGTGWAILSYHPADAPVTWKLQHLLTGQEMSVTEKWPTLDLEGNPYINLGTDQDGKPVVFVQVHNEGYSRVGYLDGRVQVVDGYITSVEHGQAVTVFNKDTTAIAVVNLETAEVFQLPTDMITSISANSEWVVWSMVDQGGTVITSYDRSEEAYREVRFTNEYLVAGFALQGDTLLVSATELDIQNQTSTKTYALHLENQTTELISRLDFLANQVNFLPDGKTAVFNPLEWNDGVTSVLNVATGEVASLDRTYLGSFDLVDLPNRAENETLEPLLIAIFLYIIAWQLLVSAKRQATQRQNSQG